MLLTLVVTSFPKCTLKAAVMGGKFATGVNDAGGNLPPVSTMHGENLPRSMTPVDNDIRRLQHSLHVHM